MAATGGSFGQDLDMKVSLGLTKSDLNLIIKAGHDFNTWTSSSVILRKLDDEIGHSVLTSHIQRTSELVHFLKIKRS